MNYIKNILPYALWIVLMPKLVLMTSINSNWTFIWTNVVFFLVYTFSLIATRGWLRKIYSILTFVLIIGVNLVELYSWESAGTVLLQQSFWVIFDTNIDEAAGVLSMVSAKMWIIGTIYTGGCVYLLLRLWKRANEAVELMDFVFAGGGLAYLLFICSLPPIRRNVPEIGLYNEYRKYQEENLRMRRFYDSRAEFNYEAELENEMARTLVIVIGESLNRHHMSLYGYPRNTTPKLCAMRDELDIYQDVISPSRATMNVMNKILSFANNENEDAFYSSPSVIEMLMKVGYKVWWIDNQGECDKVRPNSYRKIADMSDIMYVIPKIGPDTAILIKFEEALADTIEKKVIFLHLIGSHIPYEDDIPTDCRWWAADDTMDIISLQPRETIIKNLADVNMYDNTVRYNDRIISHIIDHIRKQEGARAMLYFSDHGEEMCESAPFTCRSLECLTRGQCDIPFILWRSSEYEQLIPIYVNINASYCTDDVNYAILELAGVKCSLMDSTKSIFSKAFTPKNRKLDYMYYDSLPKYKVRKIVR